MDHRGPSEKTCSACRLLLLRFLASTKALLELPRHLKKQWPRLDRRLRGSQSVDSENCGVLLRRGSNLSSHYRFPAESWRGFFAPIAEKPRQDSAGSLLTRKTRG